MRRRVCARSRRGGWAALPARPAALRRNPASRVFHFVTALQVRLITARLSGRSVPPTPPLRGRCGFWVAEEASDGTRPDNREWWKPQQAARFARPLRRSSGQARHGTSRERAARRFAPCSCRGTPVLSIAEGGARSAPLAAVSAIPKCLDVTHRSPPRLPKNRTGPGEAGWAAPSDQRGPPRSGAPERR